jgi:para-nitrobenzyl esterase
MQPDKVPKSEDCLTLNIWRPAGRSAGQLPVMVWIFGGALVHGSPTFYPGDNFARQGVVFVSLNYRLGRLGFFAHPALLNEHPGEVVGNYGFMDQLAALKWVQRNISAFGGDPNRVTIFGESAGAGSVLVHLTSSLSRGLFQRAILQSTAMPTARAVVIQLTPLTEAARRGAEYARGLGVTGEGASALQQLRALPAERFVSDFTFDDVVAALEKGSYLPGISGAILDGGLIAEAPEAALAERRQAMVPVIVGANDRDLGEGPARNKEELLALAGRRAGEARALYDAKGDQPFAVLKQKVFEELVMLEPARHLANEMARAGQPAFLYRFAYVAPASRAVLDGAIHGYELPYVFDAPTYLLGKSATDEDRRMAALVSGYWVAFAATGDPNGGGRPPWARNSPGSGQVMIFGDGRTAMAPDPVKARLDFIESLYGPNR